MEKTITLAQQREALRAQMHAQREIIALKLTRAERQEEYHPRSMIMRFLTQRPGAAIVAELATLLLGARLIRSFHSMRTVFHMVKSLRGNPGSKM